MESVPGFCIAVHVKQSSSYLEISLLFISHCPFVAVLFCFKKFSYFCCMKSTGSWILKRISNCFQMKFLIGPNLEHVSRSLIARWQFFSLKMCSLDLSNLQHGCQRTGIFESTVNRFLSEILVFAKSGQKGSKWVKIYPFLSFSWNSQILQSICMNKEDRE